MDTKPKPVRDGGDPPRKIGIAVMDNETPKRHHMLPVWFFIGVILTIYGVLIFAEGLYELSHPAETVLANLHAPIWWGVIMVVVGIIYTTANRHPN
jgi:hypothetical protein